jgi:mono/diheme cytochrome c family protein
MRKTKSTTIIDLLLIPGLLAIFLLGAGPQGEKRYDPTAASEGRESFRTYCASCHGKTAKGDGPLAEQLRVRPPDLTGLSERNGGEFPFEDVRKKIDGREKVSGHGSKDMPVWGDAFKTTDTEEQAQDRISQIAHFLWSIQVVSGE